MAKDDFKKEKAKRIKEQKAEAKPQCESEPKKEPKNSAVEKRVGAILSRHKDLPQELVESLKQSKTGTECKRKLRDYLQAHAVKEKAAQ